MPCPPSYFSQVDGGQMNVLASSEFHQPEHQLQNIGTLLLN
jgi:hypothetical protein